MSPRILFASDLHLGIHDSGRIAHFMKFLAMVEKTKAILYILGDLFNFWVCDGQSHLKHIHPLLSFLYDLSKASQVVFLPGNRDFLFSSYWKRRGGKVGWDGATLNLGNQKVVLCHGDVFSTQDVSYQKIRAILRTRWIYQGSRMLPLCFAIFLGNALRKMSLKNAARRESHMLAADFSEIIAMMEKTQADIMLCAHFHIPGIHSVNLVNRQGLVYFLPESKGEEVEYLAWQEGRFSYEKFA